MTVKAEGNIGGLPKRERKQKLRAGLDYTAIEVSYDVPDRLTGLQEVEELRRLCPHRIWNFVSITLPRDVNWESDHHYDRSRSMCLLKCMP